MPPRRALRLSALAALLAPCASGASAQAGSSAQAAEASRNDAARDSHRRMVDLLASSDRQIKQTNSQVGSRAAEELTAQLAALGADASPVARARLEHALGLQKMYLGDRRAAVDHLQVANDLIEAVPPADRPDWAEKVPYHLGLAWMVWGEGQNCVARHTSQSCLLPIGPAGVHTDPEGSRNAMRVWRAVLESSEPGSNRELSTRWLYNIAAMTLGEWPDGVEERWRIAPEALGPTSGFPHFTDVAPALGLNVTSLAGGAGVEDYDGDGRLDVVCSDWNPSGPLRLFTRTEDGSFVDRTAAAGLTGITGGLNLTQADYDSDGDVDLFVLRGGWQQDPREVHPNSLLRNGGDGTFLDVTLLAMGDEHRPTQTAGWADHDLDGDLDVYVGNESAPFHRIAGQLFRNRGDGTFEDVALASGTANLRYAKGVAWGDPDTDGDPDLYVSNYQGKNRLYENDGAGHFEDVAGERGVDQPLDSFPTWFWDFDNDGALDLYVGSYCESTDGYRLAPVVRSALGLPGDLAGPRLYRGDGHGGFTDVTAERGLDRLTVTMGANFGDLDNDGFLEVFLGTGYPFFDGLTPSVLFHNERGTFRDVTTAAGVGHLQKGHGIVFADLDEDGDLDLYAEMGGAYLGDAFGNVLFENPGTPARRVEVRLVGRSGSRSAIGARVRADLIEDGHPRSVFRTVGTGGSFGANPLAVHIGLGRADAIQRLEIVWPVSGTTQVLTDVPAGTRLQVVEGEDAPRATPSHALPFPD